MPSKSKKENKKSGNTYCLPAMIIFVIYSSYIYFRMRVLFFYFFSFFAEFFRHFISCHIQWRKKLQILWIEYKMRKQKYLRLSKHRENRNQTTTDKFLSNENQVEKCCDRCKVTLYKIQTKKKILNNKSICDK